MTLQQKVKNYLEIEPRARERRNRARAVWNILEQNQSVSGGVLLKLNFIDFVFREIISINRLINKVQQDHAYLRGEDYNDKKHLQQQAQTELGYEVGFYGDTSRNTQNKLI